MNGISSESDRKRALNVWLPLLIASVLAVGMSLGFSIKGGQANAASSRPTVSTQTKQLEEIIRYIDAKYVDDVETDKIVDEAIKSILKELDPHSNYISREQLAAVNEELEGNFDGVGIQFLMKEDTIYVVSAIKEGPSEKEGVRAGDRIITIEGENVAGKGLKSEDVVKLLKGERNTSVNMEIKRNGQTELLPFKITRDRIPIYSVDAGYMLNENTGYIKINRFSATTAQEFVDKLDAFKTEGMEHLVIDLRQNPGGYLNAATRLLDQIFKDKKLLVYTEGTNYTKNEYKSSGRSFYDIDKVVVLIDEGSASASEIMAGAIQDWDRGVIIGRRSFGKGLVQEQYNLSSGGALRLTVARYYTPSGRSIQKPYNSDRTSYNHEMYNRYENGELTSRDSIHIEDTTKYYTEAGRVVYGGGGITPDIFVPIREVLNNAFYTESVEYIAPFVYNHLDGHRADYEKYKDIEALIKGVKISDAMLENFAKYAKKEGVEYKEIDFENSKQEFARLIKASIARQFFDNEGFYRVMNSNDEMVRKALQELSKN